MTWGTIFLILAVGCLIGYGITLLVDWLTDRR